MTNFAKYSQSAFAEYSNKGLAFQLIGVFFIVVLTPVTMYLYGISGYNPELGFGWAFFGAFCLAIAYLDPWKENSEYERRNEQ